MADGIYGLRKVQLGKETTAGTAVAATVISRMMGTIEDLREVTFPEETVGYLGGTDRTYIANAGATITLEGPATFEDLPYVFNAGIAADAAPTTDAGTGNLWEWDFATTTARASSDLTTLTIEAGDNNEALEMEFSYVESFTLTGNNDEAWQLSSVWQGRQCSTSTFTSLASTDLLSVEEMLFNKTKIYIDATTDTIGTTQVTGTLVSATVNVTTGWIRKPVTDGNLYFQDIKCPNSEITLDLTMEHNPSLSAERDYWRSQTPRQIRLQVTGDTLATTDTYSTKLFTFDVAGKWESLGGALEEQDGDNIVTGTFRARWNTEAALYAEIDLINELASLP